PGGRPGPVNLSAAQIAQVNAALAPSAPLQLNRPFLGMAAGFSAAGGQYANPPGIGDTLLRPATVGGGPTSLRLVQGPANVLGVTHPYQQTELLTKIYGRLTTRSHVFAVWVTVGFFEVVPGTENDSPPKLGREVGREEGRHIRHRMFAIVDRSQWSSGPLVPWRCQPV